MAGKRFKGQAAKRESGSFVQMTHAALQSENFRTLSPYGLKLLMELISQYKGTNNGDLCVSWSLMKDRGWRSSGTLNAKKKELVDRGWIVVARQGGRNLATLYALTIFAVDDCKGKIDIEPTGYPSSSWRKFEKPTELPSIGRHLKIRSPSSASGLTAP